MYRPAGSYRRHGSTQRDRKQAGRSPHADSNKRKGNQAARSSDLSSSDEDVAEEPSPFYRPAGGQRSSQTAGPSGRARHYARSGNDYVDEEDSDTDNRRRGEGSSHYVGGNSRQGESHHSKRDRSSDAPGKRHRVIGAVTGLFRREDKYPAGRYRQTYSRSAAGQALHTQRDPSPGRSAKDERRKKREETFFTIGKALGETLVPAIRSAFGKKRQQNSSDSDTSSYRPLHPAYHPASIGAMSAD